MKKVLLAGFALLSISFAKAQSTIFNPFKVDFALGYAVPQGSGSKGGVALALEPKYAVMDQLAVGLRLEAALTVRGFDQNYDGSSGSGKIAASASYLATADYYFSNGGFRPFVGGGVGIFALAHGEYDDNTGNSAVSTTAVTRFGEMLRVGFETGHFRLGVEYNFVPRTSESATDDYGNTYDLTSRNSYLGIKLGFFIGGSRM
jgi:outer membrane protein X